MKQGYRGERCLDDIERGGGWIYISAAKTLVAWI